MVVDASLVLAYLALSRWQLTYRTAPEPLTVLNRGPELATDRHIVITGSFADPDHPESEVIK